MMDNLIIALIIAVAGLAAIAMIVIDIRKDYPERMSKWRMWFGVWSILLITKLTFLAEIVILFKL